MSELLSKGEQLCSTLREFIDSNGKLVLRADLAESLTAVHADLTKRKGINGNVTKYDALLNELTDVLRRIKGVHIFAPNDPKLNYFEVHMFEKTGEFSVDMCPPSTIQGLFSLRQQLTVLSIVNSGITELVKVLSPVEKKYLSKLQPMIFPGARSNIPDAYLWSKLVTLKLSNCGIAKIDQSMHFFPNIKYLDLSRNSITHIIHLQDCICLKHINLSHNRLTVLSNLERVLGSVSRLNVSYNEIYSLDGIDKIYSLERLNASHNLLDDFAEVQHVTRLPCLESLSLADNPFSDNIEYRLNVFLEFIQDGGVMMGNRSFPALDGRPLTPAENKKLRRLMFRATTDAQAESSYADEKYLNRDSEPSSPVPGGVAGVSFGAPGSAEGRRLTPKTSRHSMDGSGRTASTVSAPGRRAVSPKKRTSADGPEGKDYVVKAPLTSTEFQAVVSPSSSGRAISRGPRDSRMSSTATRSTSPKRGGPSRDSVSSARSASCSTPSSLLAELAKVRTFKCKRSNRPKRLVIISYGEKKKEHFPDMAEIEEFVLEMRIRDEEERVAEEQRQAAIAQQQALELRNQQLQARKMESFSTVPRNLSLDVHDVMRSHSMSIQGGGGGGGEAVPEYPLNRGFSMADRSYSVTDRGQSIADRSHSVVDRGHSIADQPGHFPSFDARSHSLSVSGSYGVPPEPLRMPASSMDDFQGRITENTRFNILSDTTDVASPPISTPSGGSSGKHIVPNMITTPTTNLVKHVANPSNSTVRIKVVNPNQMRPSEVEELETGVGSGLEPLVEKNEEDEDAEEQGQEQGGLFDEDAENDSVSELVAAHEDRAARGEYDEGEEDEDEYDEEDRWGPETERSVYTYVGDPEYKTLSVLDNLDLYFREQVFGPDRPSGDQPYIKETVVPFAAGPYANKDDVVFVKAPMFAERFIVLFSENIIDVTAEAKVRHAESSGVPDASAAGSSFMGRQRSASSAAQPQNEYVAQETKVILVLTDLNVYFLKLEGFAVDQLFEDAPLPTLIRVHPIYSLSKCTIYFGFQRCVLGFSDATRLEQKNSKNTSISFNDDPTVTPIVQQYMIVTRDKQHTYPIATRLPQIANAIRGNLKPSPLPNVKIENKDSQVIENVTKFTASVEPNPDIGHYQMVFQVWRTRPGVRIPRTVVLTQNLILLCSEELQYEDIGLKVLDSASLKDVFKIYLEDNPLYLTFVFKPENMFASRRKWRLCTDSRNTVNRLLEESRRACAEKGNPDV